MLTKESYAVVKGNFWDFLEASNEKGGDMFVSHYEASYTDGGVLDSKTKRLMAMCGAIASGCDGCIIGQATYALDLGATKEEVLEACEVALSLGGTMAGSKAAGGVIQLLKDRGMF